MNRLRPGWLLIISASAALLGFCATAIMLSHGYGSPVLPMSSSITLAGIGAVIVVLGILVWRDQRHITEARRRRDEKRRREEQGLPGPSEPPASGAAKPRRLHPLQAVRVVAAAQACGYAGALIAGWHGGVLIDLGPAAGLSAPNASSSLVMIIGGLIWVIIGFVVEQLCRIPPDEGGSAGPTDGYTEGGPPSHRPEEGYARGTS
ncbi:DUF3180 domain-containing protein [Nesterenkonia lacusekhoensis]|uniref:DUF3180 domain-containing protein n=1 Tax=Nesterenkonia lacusekhoensis TaxID=150832 RepID=A0ABS4T698_9MICC|nr:hypothetical protein [Nesterenkonia lacusekhoensis]